MIKIIYLSLFCGPGYPSYCHYFVVFLSSVSPTFQLGFCSSFLLRAFVCLRQVIRKVSQGHVAV